MYICAYMCSFALLWDEQIDNKLMSVQATAKIWLV